MRIILTVTNDLHADQRMHKTAINLQEAGYDVLLLGRMLPTSQALHRNYETKRMKLLFKTGFCFYAWYNIRLFLFLIFSKWDVVLSCDMDSLPSGYLASKLLKRKLVFDSHELFSEVPEIQSKPLVKLVWRKLESFILPRLKYAYTVSQSIADFYSNLYGIEMGLVRNVPFRSNLPLRNPALDRYILYQGSLNQGRGLERLVEAMQELDNVKLIIAGAGILDVKLRDKVNQLKLNNKVEFKGHLAFDELKELTSKAYLGVSLEEDIGLNYRFALPNKMFDYMQAGVPFLVSDLPEMGKVARQTGAGYIISPKCTSAELAAKFHEIISDEKNYLQKRENAVSAREDYVWEEESKKQLKYFQDLEN